MQHTRKHPRKYSTKIVNPVEFVADAVHIRSRIHEPTISLGFPGIILRVFRLDVSVGPWLVPDSGHAKLVAKGITGGSGPEAGYGPGPAG